MYLGKKRKLESVLLCAIGGCLVRQRMKHHERGVWGKDTHKAIVSNFTYFDRHVAGVEHRIRRYIFHAYGYSWNHGGTYGINIHSI